MTGTPDEQRPKQPPRIGTVYERAVQSVLAVVVAVLFGIGADHYFESSPIGVLVGLGVGFGSMVLGLTRLMKDLAPPPEDAGNAKHEPGSDPSDRSQRDDPERDRE